MQRRSWLVLTFLTVVLAVYSIYLVRGLDSVRKARRHSTSSITQMWVESGFELGRIGGEPDGDRTVFQPKGAELRNPIRAFRAKPGIAAKQLMELPPIDEPFGLDLSGVTLPADDLRHLKRFPKLVSLVLSGDQLTDDAIKLLSEQEMLQSLSRASTAEGKRTIRAESVAVLDLTGTRVTDRGLPYLVGLKNLGTLRLGNTSVTESGVAEFHKALPKCRIDR